MEHKPVIIITGASSGIGAETARKFSGAGYRVVLAARRAQRLESLAAEITAWGGSALPIKCDVTVQAEIEDVINRTMEHYQRVDILFNNAGIGHLDWLENLDAWDDFQLHGCGRCQSGYCLRIEQCCPGCGYSLGRSGVEGIQRRTKRDDR